MHLRLCLVALVASASAYSGVATFNDYAAQSNTVCGPKTGVSGTFGAAIGDLSPNAWSGDVCSGSINTSEWQVLSNPINSPTDNGASDGQNPVSGYEGPACPTTTCGECFQVCNAGGYGGASVGGVGNCATVNIIDVCPSESAFNFCKTDVPAPERCGSSSTNSFDIDQSAYLALTGTSWTTSSPNLMISVESSSC